MLVGSCGTIAVVLLSANGECRNMVFHLGEERTEAQVVLVEILFGGFVMVCVDFNEVACAGGEESTGE